MKKTLGILVTAAVFSFAMPSGASAAPSYTVQSLGARFTALLHQTRSLFTNGSTDKKASRDTKKATTAGNGITVPGGHGL